jgi:ABC-2 type transport system permease protein
VSAMRRPSVFLQTLRTLRWQVFWYGAGLALMAAFVVYVYPSYASQLADIDIPEAMRALIGDVDYGTGKGFLSAEFLSWVPIVVVVFAVMSGTGAIGNEEANGTLDLLLAQPISRRRVAIEKLAGLFAATALLALITYIGWLISVPFVDIDVSLGDMAVSTANLVPLMLALQSLACLASVTLPSRGVATGAVTAFAVASYFINYIASLVDALEPIRVVSVFYHYHGTEVLTDGVQWAGLVVLLVLCAVFSALTVAGLERREIGGGQLRFSLPWLRSRTDEPSSATS